MAKKLFIAAMLATGVAASHSALAAERVSYDYIGAQFITQDLDDYGCQQDGLQLNGSVSLNSDVFLAGSVSDVSGGKCGSTNLTATIGYHTLFGADSSIYGLVGVDYISVDSGDDDSGLILAGGVRGFVAPNLEAKAQVSYYSAGDGNIVIGGGVSYFVNRNVSLTAEVGLGTDVSTLGLGARFHF